MGGLNKNRNRKKHLPNMEDAPQPAGQYVLPPREKCEEDVLRAMPSSSNARVRTVGRSWRQAGRLVFFFLGLQYLDEHGEWLNYFTIDCGHGHAHGHRYVNGERDGELPETICVLNQVSDVTNALRLSLSRLQQEKTILESQIEVKSNE